MRLPRYNLLSLIMLVTLVAVVLAWWVDRRHLNTELDLAHAQLRMRELTVVPVTSGSGGTQQPPNAAKTPEEFVLALREIDDWYEFADRTADPFAKTDAAVEAIPAIIELLADDDAEVRFRAACTLGKIKKNANHVVPALVPLLEDPVPNVRWHAAFALAQFGAESSEALPELQKQMLNDDSPIATFATLMVKQIDPEAKIDARLVTLVRSKRRENRLRAVMALPDQVPAKAAKQTLEDAFDAETDPEVRVAISTALSRVSSQ